MATCNGALQATGMDHTGALCAPASARRADCSTTRSASSVSPLATPGMSRSPWNLEVPDPAACSAGQPTGLVSGYSRPGQEVVSMTEAAIDSIAAREELTPAAKKAIAGAFLGLAVD